MSAEPVYVIYDGDCPFCSAYVKLVRLREAAGKVVLLNARDPHPIVEEIRATGLDLDEGMAMKIGDQILHGDAVINRLALMSSPSDFLNRLNWWIFRSPTRSKLLYPFMRAGRNTVLKLMGRRKLSA